MRVAIIGAKGMLGQCLVRVFSDCEVLAWDRNDLDITNAAQVRARITSAKPDVIINAAAYNAVDRAEEDVERANVVNGEAVEYIAEAAAECGATLVHFSTDYVLGGRSGASGMISNLKSQISNTSLRSPPPITPSSPHFGGLRSQREGGDQSGRAGTMPRPYAEDAVLSPLSAYGRSKLLGEQRVQEIAARHPRWRWYIIRTSRLFGAAGASASTKKSFVDAILAKSKTTDHIEVVDEEWSSPTYAPDLAVATRELVLPGTTGFFAPTKASGLRMTPGGVLSSGIYHRTNDGACTWYEFARVILDTIGWKGTLVSVPASQFPRAAKRPACSVLATTKLPPMRGWESALQEYLQANTQYPISNTQ